MPSSCPFFTNDVWCTPFINISLQWKLKVNFLHFEGDIQRNCFRHSTTKLLATFARILSKIEKSALYRTPCPVFNVACSIFISKTLATLYLTTLKVGEGGSDCKGELCGIEYEIIISTKNWLCKKCCQQVLSLSAWIAITTITALFFVRSSSIVITDLSDNQWE